MTLRIPKITGTYADALLAFGLVRLIARWLAAQSEYRGLILHDMGDAYVLSWTPEAPLPAPRESAYFRGPAPYLLNRKVSQPPHEDLSTLNVDELTQALKHYREQYFALRKALRSDEITAEHMRAQLEDLMPPPETDVARFVGDWRMQAMGGYNKIVGAWSNTRPHFGSHLQALLDAGTGTWNEDQRKAWRKMARTDGIPADVTASQLLNPHQGKGLNETKSNALRMGNLKQPWPTEYLKAAGLWEAAFPRRTSDTQDWKVYILAPRDLPMRHLAQVHKAFRRVLWHERGRDATALKTDITSLLLFYRTWLNYVEDWDTSEAEAEFLPPPANPAAVVHGFYVAQFKLLSANAYTMINQSFLRLPEWGQAIQSRQDVAAWQALIDEHLGVIRHMEEGHSDGYDMLKDYRDFVAGGRWSAFFAFMHNFAHYAMARMNQNRFVPLFTIPHLRRLLMTEKRFAPILESEGFRNFAYAIRHSTVIPQHRKARKLNTLYDIRYGLGAELKRKATVEDEFIVALMDFAQSYNRENAQVLESKGQQMRRDLRTFDVEEMVRLVDEYGSEVVANLLVAYGYAREPREEPEQEAEHEDQ